MALTGKILVFTGTLSTDRKKATAMAEAEGAKVTGSVSGTTTHLVAGPGAGSKVAAAEAKGVTIWTEDDFLAAIAGAGGGGGKKRGAAAAAPAEKAAKKTKPAAAAPAAAAKTAKKTKASEPAAAAPAAKAAKKTKAVAAVPAAALLEPTASNIGAVNPVSGLAGQGHVLNEGGQLYDVDLALTDAAKNSNKFYRLQVQLCADSDVTSIQDLPLRLREDGSTDEYPTTFVNHRCSCIHELVLVSLLAIPCAEHLFGPNTNARAWQVVESVSGSEYWLVQHWGRIGTSGQSQVKDFAGKAQVLKEFQKKFKEKAGVEWANRGAATSNVGSSGKYRTLTEQRVAAAGGRIADATVVCFCLSWDDDCDLDLHCKLPNGDDCYFGNKQPTPYATLDVDRLGYDRGNQVENIFLTVNSCVDGDYEFYVHYFSGHRKPVDFTIVCNQLGKKIDQATAKAKWDQNDQGTGGNTPCMTLTMKKGKVAQVKFAIKTKNVPLE